MARKKIEPITSLGTDTDKLTVQKSQPLFALWQSELTLAEFKILDTYLARIDSHHPERRQVQFEKGELEDKLGVTQIKRADLEKRLDHLMGNVVTIPDKNSRQGFRKVTLFEEVEAYQDDDGLWQITLECTQKAMKYFFNVEQLGYLKYKLRCITSLTSRYSYILFIYLEANRYRKRWRVDLDELKLVLNCEGEETYKEYKHFNNLILKKIQKELLEKTECRYTYEPIKKGRKVVAIEFEVATLQIEDDSEAAQIPGQMTIDEYEAGRNRELWESLLDEFEFTKEEYDELCATLRGLPARKLPEDTTTGTNSLEFRRYHYLDLKIKAMKRYDSRKTVKSKYSYLLKMIQTDGKEGSE